MKSLNEFVIATFASWRESSAVARHLFEGLAAVVGAAVIAPEGASLLKRVVVFGVVSYLAVLVSWLATLYLVAWPVGVRRKWVALVSKVGELKSELASLSDTTLDFSVEVLNPTQPPNLGGAWRVSLAIRNLGGRAQLYAKALRPVRGIDEEEYGDFFLEWDLHGPAEIELHRDARHTLHIAYLKDRTLRFVGPETSYGPQTKYKPITVVDPEVQVFVEVRDTTTGDAGVIDLRIGLDHENRPSVTAVIVDPSSGVLGSS